MKKLIYISCIFLFYGCIFTYDPARGLLYIHNNSDENVYVYSKFGNADSLTLVSGYVILENRNVDTVPLFSGLELFTWIDANTKGAGTIGGTRKKPRLSLSGNEKEVTLFFITEKTIRDYNLEEIHKNQMFVKKITLTEEKLKNKNWEYIYSPLPHDFIVWRIRYGLDMVLPRDAIAR
jgi:hypothetical protein